MISIICDPKINQLYNIPNLFTNDIYPMQSNIKCSSLLPESYCKSKVTWRKMCPWDMDAHALANRKYKHRTCKKGDMIQLKLKVLKTKYQTKLTYKTREIFDKILLPEIPSMSWQSGSRLMLDLKRSP